MGRKLFYCILPLLLFLTGCISGCSLCEAGGLFAERGVDHCYQWLSVKTGDDSGCEKIPGTGFTGQNPPKDKCYLRIAEGTKDPEPCTKIVGGINSYSQDECFQGVGAAGGSADGCSGVANEEDCRSGVVRGAVSEGREPACGAGFAWAPGGLGGGSCVKMAEEPAVPTTGTGTGAAGGTGAKDEPRAPDTATTTSPPKTPVTASGPTRPGETPVKEPAAPSASSDKPTTGKPAWESFVDSVTGGVKAIGDAITSATDKVTEVGDKVKGAVGLGEDEPAAPSAPDGGERLSDKLKDVEDEDERRAITQEFIKQRQQQDATTIEQQRRILQDIMDRRERDKRLDDAANTIKANTWDKAVEAGQEQIDEATGAAEDYVKGQTYDWVKGRVPKNYRDKLEKAEGYYNTANEQLEKAGEHFDRAKGIYDQATAVYGEVKETADNVRRIQDKVASGEISEDRGRVLKGGVLLGKGLEHATKYIPIFGDTASTVTKETFGVAINVGEKIASHTTRTDRCIEDPLNCDV